MIITPKILNREDDILTYAEFTNLMGITFSNITETSFEDYSFQATQIANIMMSGALADIGGFNGVYFADPNTGLNTAHLTSSELTLLKQALAQMIGKWDNFLIAPVERQPFDMSHNIGPENKSISAYPIEDLVSTIDQYVRAMLIKTRIEQYVRSKGTSIPITARGEYIKYGDLKQTNIVSTSQVGGNNTEEDLNILKNEISLIEGSSSATLPILADESISGTPEYQRGLNLENKTINENQNLRLDNIENTEDILDAQQLKVGKLAQQLNLEVETEIIFNATPIKPETGANWNLEVLILTDDSISNPVAIGGTTAGRVFQIEFTTFTNASYLVELNTIFEEIARWPLSLPAFPAGLLTDITGTTSDLFISGTTNNTVFRIQISVIDSTTPGSTIFPTTHNVTPSSGIGIEAIDFIEPGVVAKIRILTANEIWEYNWTGTGTSLVDVYPLPPTLIPVSKGGFAWGVVSKRMFVGTYTNEFYEIEFNESNILVIAYHYTELPQSDYSSLGIAGLNLYALSRVDEKNMKFTETGRYTVPDTFTENTVIQPRFNLLIHASTNSFEFALTFYRNSISEANKIDVYNGTIPNSGVENATFFHWDLSSLNSGINYDIGDVFIITITPLSTPGNISLETSAFNTYEINVLQSAGIDINTDIVVNNSTVTGINQSEVNDFLLSEINRIETKIDNKIIPVPVGDLPADEPGVLYLIEK